jgi:hypothetical protein
LVLQIQSLFVVLLLLLLGGGGGGGVAVCTWVFGDCFLYLLVESLFVKFCVGSFGAHLLNLCFLAIVFCTLLVQSLFVQVGAVGFGHICLSFGDCFCTFGAIAFCFSSVPLAFGTYIKLSGVLVFFPWLFLLFCERWSPS